MASKGTGDFPLRSSWPLRARARGAHVHTGLLLRQTPGEALSPALAADWLFDAAPAAGSRQPPTFVSAVSTLSWSSNASPRLVGPLAAQVGDVPIVLSATEGTDGTNFLAITGTGVTLALEQEEFSVADCEVEGASGVVTTAGDISASVTNVSGNLFGANLSIFRDSDGPGSSGKAVGTADGRIAFETTQANSAVVVLVADWNARDGDAAVYLPVNGAAPVEQVYAFIDTRYTVYILRYADCGPAGLKTFGIDTGVAGTMKANVIAIEILGSGVAPSGHPAKWFDGTAWQTGLLKVYDGAAWVAGQAKVYDGAAWQ